MVGLDNPVSGKNVRSVYINGVSVLILDMLPNGDIKVEVKFDHVDIEEDVRWCAPDIVLNEIPTTHGYSLVVKQDKTLTLDHGTAATKMNAPTVFENEEVFTSHTTMHVKNGAYINLESGSEMVIDRKSILSMEAGSVLYVQNGATLRIRREGKLELLDGSLLQVENGGKVIVEGNSTGYSRGSIVYHEGARINLEGSEAHVDLAGLLHLEDNAIFHLSNSTELLRTYGKIYFRSASTTQVTAGANTSWAVLGYNATQEVIVNQKASLIFPASMINFVLRDLKVTQYLYCSIVPPVSNVCDINLRYVHFAPPLASFGHNGVSLYGQANVTIRDCHFYSANIGLSCYNIALGNGLVVRDSYFENCTDGINTYYRHLILYDTNFSRCDNDWYASGMTGTSGMQNVNASGTALTNVFFRGNATLVGDRSYFGNGDYGIRLDGATGRMKCIEVGLQNTSAIEVVNGGSLIMNSNWPGNNLSGNEKTITLNEAVQLNLNYGRNDLRSTTFGTQSIVYGSLICPSNNVLNANRNVWNNSGTDPATADYDLTGNCPTPTFSMTIIDNSPMNDIGSCLTEDLPEGQGDMSEALQGGTFELTDSSNSSGLPSLLQSLNSSAVTGLFVSDDESDSEDFMLSEIDEDIDTQGSLFNDFYSALLQAHGLGEEMSTVHFLSASALLELFQRGESMSLPLSSDNVAAIPTAQQVHELLDDMAQNFAASQNAKYAFWTGIWAAEALHSSSNSVAALSYLATEAPSPYDGVSEKVVNRFTCQMEYELEAVLPTYEEWAYNISLCDGDAYDNAKSNSVEASATSKGQEPFEAVVYPNPTSGQLSLEMNRDHLDVRIEIYDMGGRMVRQFDTFSGDPINVSSLNQGLYLMRLSEGTQWTSMRFMLNY